MKKTVKTIWNYYSIFNSNFWLLASGFIFLLVFVSGFTNAQVIRFTDVAASAGVQGLAGSPYSTNCALGDYNNDGYIDIYVTNWGTAVSDAINELYSNNGDNTFTEAGALAGVGSSNNSISAVWGDYDNDGYLDLYVVNYYEQDELYHNNGDGTFTDVTFQAGINIIPSGNEIAAVWGDYNNDGYLDLYLCKYYAENELYHNNGDGTFSLTIGSGLRDIRDSEGAVWVDYNNDGYIDLYVVNREQDNRFFKSNTDGTFTEISGTTGLNNTEIGKNCAWSDFDNDGDFDVYIANIGANSLYINDNFTTFTETSPEKNVRYSAYGWESWDAVWGDFDGDGDVDLFTVGGSESNYNATSLFINSGQIYGFVFGDITDNSGIAASSLLATSCSIADYDDDGDPDIFITTNNENALYQNQKVSNSYDYLKVRVKGKGAGFTNRFGIGCKVKVYEKGSTTPFWFKEIRSGSGPQELLFGLEKEKTYTVEVIFPGSDKKSVTEDVTIPRAQPLLIEEQ